jgi:murein DD-endopeptidase MepM/ murein hydrolase activator NlpD
MIRFFRNVALSGLIAVLAWSPNLILPAFSAQAHEGEVHEVGGDEDLTGDLEAEVKAKEQRINELNSVINKYKERIQDQISAQINLQNEIGLLENRVRERELAIERTKTEIDLATLEIGKLSQQIALEEQRYERRKEALASIIAEMQDAQSVSLLESFVARPTLSEFFRRVEELDLINQDVAEAIDEIKAIKFGMEEKRAEVEGHRAALEAQIARLEQEQYDLEQQRAAKSSLIAETSSQEAEFQRILYELRQQQQQEANDAARLEQQLKQKLDAIDGALARGDVLLNWPVSPDRITASFHDPTYPFRHLFEHSGVDIAVPVGTPVRAAAGGYIAFTRLGKQYGNYIMVIHSGGIATVYAHLSKFNVAADTYVERGDIIGYSGGAAGAYGSGLSTGPHLHFEVRQNGIPTNPQQFLPSR